MQNRFIALVIPIVLAVMLLVPVPAVADSPDTGLESLINEWRAEQGVDPLGRDERLYAAVQEVADDGTYCPQDQVILEFAIGAALYRAGYRGQRAYGMLLCGDYPTPQDVMSWIRQRGGPRHPDLEDIGVTHLAGLDFVRANGNHVSDIWILLAADPVD